MISFHSGFESADYLSGRSLIHCDHIHTAVDDVGSSSSDIVDLYTNILIALQRSRISMKQSLSAHASYFNFQGSGLVVPKYVPDICRFLDPQANHSNRRKV